MIYLKELFRVSFFARMVRYHDYMIKRKWSVVINNREQYKFASYLESLLIETKEKSDNDTLLPIKSNNKIEKKELELLIVKYTILQLKNFHKDKLDDLRQIIMQLLTHVNETFYETNEWLGIYRFLTRYTNSLTLNNLIKNQALKRSNNNFYKKKIRMREYDQLLKSLLETGDLEKLNLVVNYRKYTGLKRYLTNFIQVKAIVNYCHKKNVSTIDKLNKSFKTIIQGSKILIVGPTQDHEFTIKDFINYDVIVNFNYLLDAKKSQNQNDFKHTEKLISYYYSTNNNDIKYFVNNVLSKISFAVVNEKMFKVINNEHRNIKKMRKINHFETNFVTNYNHIQRCVLDLMMYDPKSITITNSNFYYMNNYKKDYIHRAYNEKKYRDIILAHDQIMQLRLIKNLVLEGLVQVDNLIKSILDMDENIFLEKLERNFFSRSL